VGSAHKSFPSSMRCSDALVGQLGCHAIAPMRVADFVGADVVADVVLRPSGRREDEY
jgi:3-hydroxyacyl-CoA dehydrogenase